MAKEITLNTRLTMVQAGLNGVARRIRRDLEGLEKLEKHLEQDATVLTMFRTCIRSIRAETDQLVTEERLDERSGR